MLPKDKTAIVGIGWTAFSRNSGVSTMTIAAEASLKAIDDAGLKPTDIDGVMSWFHGRADSVDPERLGEAMIMNCPFALYVDSGGHWLCGVVQVVASLVAGCGLNVFPLIVALHSERA